MALTSPEYRSLATRAARRLGTSSPSIIAAILAQWTCEIGGGDAYPPRRNNPGNVAAGWARSLGYAFSVETPNPQPGNPIVTFSSASLGADCYADGLRMFDRYSPVRAAARAGDGAGFINAVTTAGYGTSYSCAAGAFRALGGSIPARDGGPDDTPARGAPGLLAEWLARIGRQATDPIRSEDVAPFVGFLVDKGLVPRGGSSNPAVVAVRLTLERAVAAGQTWATIGATFLHDAGAGTDPLGLGAAAGQVAGAIAGIPTALGDVLRSTGLLLALLGLAFAGLYLVARGR